MGRAAGSSSHYEFVLRRATGRYDRNTTIRLPSVTHIIGDVVAKHNLPDWYANRMLDHISGLAGVMAGMAHEEGGEKGWNIAAEWLDTLVDADMLKEYLKDNKMLVSDVVNEAADRGTAEHAMLEHLAKCFMEDGEEAAEGIARRALNRNETSNYAKAISAWWLDRYPHVVDAERVLYSLSMGCAGTVDLVTRGPNGEHCITDLKTRKAGADAYRSDEIQVDGYADMYEETTGVPIQHRTVLLAREDGTWDEYIVGVPRGTFRKVKEVYDIVRSAGGA